jgi:hypothetical protein
MRPKDLLIGLLTGLMICTATFRAVAEEKAEKADQAEAESVSIFDEANLAVPADFKRVEPKSRIIEHEFEAKTGEGKEGEVARVTLMAAGGDVEANITRWKSQFAGGNEEANKTEQLTVGKWTVHVIDVNGTYAESMGGGPFAPGKTVNRENYAMTGAILVHPEGKKYFVKMIGPQEVVKANREAFVNMIKSIEK